MVRKIFSFTLSLVFCSQAFAVEVSLTQKDVAELVLKQGYLAEEENLLSLQSRLAVATVKSAFDYKLLFESGYKNSRLENFAGTQNDKDETYTSLFALEKRLSTGTLLGLSYAHNSLSSVFPASSTSTLPNTQTQDVFKATVVQDLWKNYFGSASRATVRAAEITYEASKLNRATNLQNIVLNAVRLFWSTYVAQESFKEALNARDRYQKLVDVVKRKNSVGYTTPGELSQVQAEFESRDQAVKLQSQLYLRSLDQLLTLLKLPAGSEVRFIIPEDIPTPPQLSAVDVEKLRTVRASQMRLKAAEELSDAARSDSYPELALVGSYAVAGIDRNSNDSLAEMTAQTHPEYYMGVRVSYSFGSDIQSESAFNRKVIKDLEQSRLNRTLLESKDRESDLNRKVQANYAIAVSAKSQRAFREKAVKELNQSYTQGRTDISVFIEALNRYFLTQVSFSQAIGDYQIALNELAAFRDELIPEPEKTRETR